MKKNTVTQDMVNIYPPWSKVRSDDQSVGYRMVNALATPMEDMSQQLITMRNNARLDTTNIDEIDVSYIVRLGDDFEFDPDTTDPVVSRYLTPTVSGTIGSDVYLVRLAPQNSVREFWYKSVPDRVSVLQTVTGVSHDVVTFTTGNGNQEGEWTHHINGGHVWIETTGGNRYIRIAEDNVLVRGSFTITGETRKGTEETETIIFPWDMNQRFHKEWKTITKIEPRDMLSGVEVSVRFADFLSGDYIDFWNLAYSENRRKVDTFWGLGTVSGLTTLDKIRYVTDEWEQLAIGQVQKEVHRSWELLDESDTNVSGIDMAIQPFKNRAWVVTSANMLYLYDLEEDMVESYGFLRDATPGAAITFDILQKTAILGEEVEFIPWHARPLLALKRFRVWMIEPDGTKRSFVNGVPTTWDASHWHTLNNTKLVRDVASTHTFTPTQRGEYKIAFEVVYSDDTTENARMVVRVESKTPLAQYDISTLVSGVASGVDFDSDQKLWVWTSSGYYQLDTHTDIMLVDYANKLLYLHEQYDEVEVITSA